jgi:hypothetical protein
MCNQLHYNLLFILDRKSVQWEKKRVQIVKKKKKNVAKKPFFGQNNRGKKDPILTGFCQKNREKKLWTIIRKKCLTVIKKSPVNEKKQKTYWTIISPIRIRPPVWPETRFTRTRLNRSPKMVRIGLYFSTRGLGRFEVFGPYWPKPARCPPLVLISSGFSSLPIAVVGDRTMVLPTTTEPTNDWYN